MSKYCIIFYFILSNLLLFSSNNPDIKIQLGHTYSVESVKISPNGQYAVSGSADKSVKLWDVITGKEIKTFYGHTNRVSEVSFSPDSKFIYSSSPSMGMNDKIIIIWDINSGNPVKYFSGFEQGTSEAVFSPDGKYAAIPYWDNKIIILEIESGKYKYRLDGHSVKTTSLCFSKDSKFLVSGSGTGDISIKLWSLDTGIEIKSFSGHTKTISCIAITPDNKYIVSGSYDTTIKIWDITNGKEIKTIYLEKSELINSICISPDGKNILAGTDNKVLKLWDFNQTKLINTYKGHTKGVNAGVFSPDSKYALSSGNDNVLKLWDISSGIEMRTFSGQTEFGLSACFSPDNKYLIIGLKDKTLKVWDLKNFKLLYTLKGHTAPVICVNFSKDGKYAVSGSEDYSIKLWDVQNGKEIKTFNGHTNYVNCLDFSPDNKYILSGGGQFDMSVRLWNIETGEQVKIFTGHKSGIIKVKYSKNGKHIFSCGDKLDKTIKIWDIESGTAIKDISIETDLWIYSAFFLNNEKQAVVTTGHIFSNNYPLLLIDLSSGKIINKLNGHTDSIYSVSGTVDDQYVISGSKDKSLILWDIVSGKEIKKFSGHSNTIWSVSFSSDNKYIISTSEDMTNKIWNYSTGEEICSLFANPQGTQWMIFNKDSYWDGSANCGEFVSMIKDLNVWNIDQFAVHNNRPDKILEKFSDVDPELVKHYYNQYIKRLRKSGLKENESMTDYHIPVVKILESDQRNNNYKIKFSLFDDMYKLQNYNIYVNNVSVYGSIGKQINTNSVELTEIIKLTNGNNKIEISCMNENGSESYRSLTYAMSEQNQKTDLYFIGFGVSKYKNSTLDLQFADKDTIDLAGIFNNMKKSYNNIYTYTFTNEECNLDNIKKAKKLLENSKPDDTFVLFIAGHGVHDTDKEATYYYLTYETDLKDLSNTAANFELIEDILQGIPPRNKLFLMDTCESGEVEEDNINNSIAMLTNKTRSIKARSVNQSRGLINVKTKKKIRSYLFEKDRFIYNDLTRRSGSIVFSSCKGGEFSYEDDKLQNGFFTYKIKEALTGNTSDLNNDNIISIDELKEFVSKSVSNLSNGLQNPTVDRDNIYQKFGFGY